MAETAGSIKWDLDLDDSKFKSKLKSSSTEAKGFGSTVSSIFGTLVKTTAVFGAAAGGALAVFGTFAVKSAGEFQQNAIAFETMLGSADKAKKLLKEVSDFAAQTPFELPQVVTGAKQLLAYGFEAEKIIPTFSALGNIAAGVGKDKLPNLVLAFGQVRAATRLTGMELRQFTEAGVPLLEVLAKQTGKTAAQIKEDIESGAVSFDMVQEAIFGMSKEGGKFFDLMKKQSKSFGGTMSNISDQYGRLARNIIGISETGEIREGSIFAILTATANSFLEFLNKNANTIQRFFIKLSDSLVSIGAMVRLLITGDFKGGIFGLQEDDPWIDALFKVRDLIINLATTALNYLKQAWEFLSPPLKQLWSDLQPLLKSLETLYQDVEPLLRVIGTAIGLGLIGSFYLLITATDKVVKSITKFSDWGHDNKEILTLLGLAILPAISAVMATMAYHAAVLGAAKLITGLLTFATASWAAVSPWIALGLKATAIAAVLAAIYKFGDWYSKEMTGFSLFEQIKSLPSWARSKFGFATGTSFAPGGLSLVGERGPELVNLPRGSQVIPNNKLRGIGDTYNIHLEGIMARSRSDLRQIGEDIISAVDEARRAKGKATILG